MNSRAETAKHAGQRSKADVREQQYLTFAIGDDTFAVGILEVREIIRFGTLTEVPTMPPHIRGVMNLRGAVLPVVDLRARFGRGAAPLFKRTCIVIVELLDDEDGLQVGILVDAVCAVVRIEDSEVEPVPTFGTGIRPDLIRGMVRRGEKFVMLVALASVFSASDTPTRPIASPESLGVLAAA